MIWFYANIPTFQVTPWRGGDFCFLSSTLSTWGFPCKKFLFSSEDTPSLLHINSISSPSFRWSIYGELMDKRWRNHEGKCLHQPSFFAGQIESLSSNKQGKKSVIL